MGQENWSDVDVHHNFALAASLPHDYVNPRLRRERLRQGICTCCRESEALAVFRLHFQQMQ